MERTLMMAKQHFNMIRFIRLLFYHIYLHFLKVDDGNKPLAKFTTFLIFTLIFGMILYFGYVFVCISYNYSTVVHTPYIFYIFLFIIVGIFIGRYVYSIEFENFDTFKDYHKKYYLYFFMIVLFTLSLFIYTGKISRERIFKQRELNKKEQIEKYRD